MNHLQAITYICVDILDYIFKFYSKCVRPVPLGKKMGETLKKIHYLISIAFFPQHEQNWLDFFTSEKQWEFSTFQLFIHFNNNIQIINDLCIAVVVINKPYAPDSISNLQHSADMKLITSSLCEYIPGLLESP